MAGATGLEPAASGVTGRRYNQLNYTPAERSCLYRVGLKLSNINVFFSYFIFRGYFFASWCRFSVVFYHLSDADSRLF